MESLTVQRIRLLIEREKETPNSFALKIGVTSGSIYNILSGGQPRRSTLQKICAAFPNITEDWLLGGDAKVLDGSERMEIEKLRQENEWLRQLVERLTAKANFLKASIKAGSTVKVVKMHHAGGQVGALRA